MVFSSEGKTEYRSVNIPADGRACKVYVNVGSLGLVIRVSDLEGRANGRATVDMNARNRQLFPVLALVFSIMFPIVGIVFCILDITMAKKENRKPSNLTIAAFVVIGIRIAVIVLIYIVTIFAAVHNM